MFRATFFTRTAIRFVRMKGTPYDIRVMIKCMPHALSELATTPMGLVGAEIAARFLPHPQIAGTLSMFCFIFAIVIPTTTSV
jgi:hypothetical protein